MGLLSGLLGNAGVVAAEQLQADYGQLLAEGEQIEVGFKVIRDTFVFTNKRLLLVDIQGMTGKRLSIFQFIFKITQFSIETAGHFDLDAELKIWIGSCPTPLRRNLTRRSIYTICRKFLLLMFYKRKETRKMKLTRYRGFVCCCRHNRSSVQLQQFDFRSKEGS